MEVKKYLATSVNQAYERARTELGVDAVLISSQWVRRKGLKNLFSKKIVEVTFAYEQKKKPYGGDNPYAAKAQEILALVDESSKKKKFGAGETEQTTQGSQVSKVAEVQQAVLSEQQLEQIDKRMNKFEEMLTDFVEKFKYFKKDITFDFADDINHLLRKMIEAEVREEFAHELAKETEKLIRAKPESPAVEALEHLLLELLGNPEPIITKKFYQKFILLLGPTGVGKTTTIAKLAADFSIKQKKKVGIINTDFNRIGAHDQLQIYADTLGIPLELVYYPDELDNVMKNMHDREIVFVDTAGKRPGDSEHKQDILNIVSMLKPEDILLCLSATTSFSSIKEIVDSYAYLENYRVLVTKLDETKHRGPVLNISWYTKKPLAYFTTGQAVPDDISIADIESVINQIIR